MVRTFVESLGIFAASIVVLVVIYMAPLTAARAYGIACSARKGIVLVGVGVLYLVFGLMLTLYVETL